MTTRLFSETDVKTSLSLEQSVDVVERTYIEFEEGRVINPSKLSMHLGDDGNWPQLNAFAIDMPAYVDWLDVAGLKWAVATWDIDSSAPISALIMLFDVERGQFKAVMEGMYITGVRTALQSIVGLKHLSRQQIETVGMIGAGFQAAFQIRLIDAFFDVESIRLFDIDTETATTLSQTLEPEIETEILVCDSPEALTGSDAILTVTNAKEPVLDEEVLGETPFVIALGTYQELTDDLITNADHIIVDHIDQCLERGALSSLADRNELTRGDIDGTIGEILTTDYRNTIDPDDRVIFVPIGLGALDISLAEHVYRSNEHRETGSEFDFIA